MRTSDLHADALAPARVSRPAHRAATSDRARPIRPATHPTRSMSPPSAVSSAPASGWRGGHRRAAGRATVVASVLTVSAGWLLAILVAPHVALSPGGRMVALFCHLTCLVVGFGAVLTVDWFSLRWLLRREPLGTVLVAARGAHLLIWLGLVVSSPAGPPWVRTRRPGWSGSSCSRCWWSASTGCSSAGSGIDSWRWRVAHPGPSCYPVSPPPRSRRSPGGPRPSSAS